MREVVVVLADGSMVACYGKASVGRLLRHAEEVPGQRPLRVVDVAQCVVFHEHEFVGPYDWAEE